MGMKNILTILILIALAIPARAALYYNRFTTNTDANAAAATQAVVQTNNSTTPLGGYGTNNGIYVVTGALYIPSPALGIYRPNSIFDSSGSIGIGGGFSQYTASAGVMYPNLLTGTHDMAEIGNDVDGGWNWVGDETLQLRALNYDQLGSGTPCTNTYFPKYPQTQIENAIQDYYLDPFMDNPTNIVGGFVSQGLRSVWEWKTPDPNNQTNFNYDAFFAIQGSTNSVPSGSTTISLGPIANPTRSYSFNGFQVQVKGAVDTNLAVNFNTVPANQINSSTVTNSTTLGGLVVSEPIFINTNEIVSKKPGGSTVYLTNSSTVAATNFVASGNPNVWISNVVGTATWVWKNVGASSVFATNNTSVGGIWTNEVGNPTNWVTYYLPVTNSPITSGSSTFNMNTGAINLHTNAWATVLLVTNQMVNGDIVFANSNGVAVLIEMSNNVPFYFTLKNAPITLP